MKALKYIGIILGVILLAWIVWAAVLPARMDSSNTIEIDRNAAFVYDVSKDFNFYKQWNPWSKMDPAAEATISGTGRELGDTWTWKGEKIGEGVMTHKEFEQDKRILNEIVFTKPNPGGMSDEWLFEEKDGKTMVTWKCKSNEDTPFMARPMMAIFMSGVFEAGMQDFKKLVEGITDNPKPRQVNTAYTPEVVEEAEITYLAVKDSCPVGDLAKHLQDNYGKLQAYMKKNNIEPTGNPMAIYWSYDEKGSTVFETAMPVKAGTKGSGEFYTAKTDGGKSVSVIHMGEYNKSGDAHMVIAKYAKDNNIKINEAIEIYENDPAKVKPEELRTKVVYPVKG